MGSLAFLPPLKELKLRSLLTGHFTLFHLGFFSEIKTNGTDLFFGRLGEKYRCNYLERFCGGFAAVDSVFGLK